MSSGRLSLLVSVFTFSIFLFMVWIQFQPEFRLCRMGEASMLAVAIVSCYSMPYVPSAKLNTRLAQEPKIMLVVLTLSPVKL